jgi:hypothetical protein
MDGHVRFPDLVSQCINVKINNRVSYLERLPIHRQFLAVGFA